MEPIQEQSAQEKKSSVNKHGLSRDIPDGVKRQVRQRCGFGCVLCGIGIYQYDHFDPEYTEAKDHDPNGITLLCSNHHTEKTSGTLSLETVKQANANPKAIRQKEAGKKFDLRTDNPIVILGTARFEKVPLILLAGGPVLTIQPGEEIEEPFLLSAELYDSKGRPILKIERNEWKTPTDTWDCKAEGKKIEIRSGSGQIELILRQEPPTTIVIERLSMINNGFQIQAHEGRDTIITTPTGITLSTTSCSVIGRWIGIMATDNSISVGLGAQEVSFGGLSGRISS